MELALKEISSVVGLEFRYVGDSDTTPRAGGSSKLRNGARTPVLIAWSTPEETDLLETAKLARGIAMWVEIDGVREYRGGAIAVHAERAGTLHEGFGRRGHATLLLHEWGHVLGLAHSSDNDTVMHHELARGDGRLGDSDRASLAALYPKNRC